MAFLRMKIAACPSISLVYENVVFVSKKDGEVLRNSGATHVEIIVPGSVKTNSLCKTIVHLFKVHKEVAEKTLAVSKITRQALCASLADEIQVKPYSVPDDRNLNLIHVTFHLKSLGSPIELKEAGVRERLATHLSKDVLSEGATFIFEESGSRYFSAVVMELKVVDPTAEAGENFALVVEKGILTRHTFLELRADSRKLQLIKSEEVPSGAPKLFGPQWRYADMGIGGLDSEFTHIFRRAFASRTLPPKVVQKLGVDHVRGLLLFGPPGTGKTLIARRIGKMLQGREPKVVNGPEILNKYVGQSEENIRALFADAEEDSSTNGENSDLHIIIFDEIDAICKQRGTSSGSTGVHDTVVNQLLSKMDGIDALNNVLVIGMTNRKDLIDSALLRPGRFEVHVEIGLPDEEGRKQILKIHMKTMRENGFLGRDVNIDELARRTKNFSGAEIAGLVKSATSFAYYGSLNIRDEGLPEVDAENLKVDREAFLNALEEVTPAFGVSQEKLEAGIAHGILDYSDFFHGLMASCKRMIEKSSVASCPISLLTFLLQGDAETGKTALACHLAKGCGFPLTKILSPQDFVGCSGREKAQRLLIAFEDAYKSPQSLLILDELERLLDYVEIGPRFSNEVLQTLMVLLKRKPPFDAKNNRARKLIVIGTTSSPQMLEDIGLGAMFMSVKGTPRVALGDIASVLRLKGLEVSATELRTIEDIIGRRGVGIKRLLIALEMAMEDGQLSAQSFAKSAGDLGVGF